MNQLILFTDRALPRASPPIRKNGGTLEKGARMANHAGTRATRFHDRRAA
jgi:hypothetical protein